MCENTCAHCQVSVTLSLENTQDHQMHFGSLESTDEPRHSVHVLCPWEWVGFLNWSSGLRKKENTRSHCHPAPTHIYSKAAIPSKSMTSAKILSPSNSHLPYPQQTAGWWALLKSSYWFRGLNMDLKFEFPRLSEQSVFSPIHRLGFRKLENPTLETYSKIWLLNIYITCTSLTLYLMTMNNLIDFNAATLQREHQLWRADPLNS